MLGAALVLLMWVWEVAGPAKAKIFCVPPLDGWLPKLARGWRATVGVRLNQSELRIKKELNSANISLSNLVHRTVKTLT